MPTLEFIAFKPLERKIAGLIVCCASIIAEEKNHGMIG
jgi:hypothetical protein